MSAPRAVSFDFGQTLATLDGALLAEKLSRLAPGATFTADAIEAGTRRGWAVYDAAVRAGASGHPWKRFMETLLEVAGLEDPELRATTVDALWDDQPRVNLWRKPIDGMLDLCRSLSAAGVQIGVLSNSEGKLVELMHEMDIVPLFRAVADSGKLGIEKPDPRIFHWMADALGVLPEEVVHIGDVRGADVDGALAVGMFAIWYGGDRSVDLGPRGHVCHGHEEVRATLRALGVSR
jgi:HAD superfamily hydrolase (TIGR01509 family)